MFDTPEQKAALKAAIDAAVEEATSGLAAKNSELLGEVKKLKKGREIDPGEIERLEQENETLRSQVAESGKAVKKLTGELDATKKTLESEAGFTQRLLIDNGLTEALVKSGVTNPVHAKAAQAMLRAQVQVSIDGDQRLAKVGDKALADFVSEWAKGDEGKHFVTAQNNSGGGATGGAGSHGLTTMTRSAFEGLSPQARSDFAKQGGKLTD